MDSANKDKSGKSFKDKIEDYAKSMDDLGAVLGDTAVNAFGKLEDSLTEFVTTGKLQFQAFVASIIADLAKLAVKFAIVNTALYYDKNNPISKTAEVDKPEAIFFSEKFSIEDSLGYLVNADALFISEKLDAVKDVKKAFGLK